MKTIQLTILLSSTLLFSCSSKETEKTDVTWLHDIWALETIDGEKVDIDESIKEMPRLEIFVEEERVYGNTGCNSFNCKVNIEENKISFSDVIATEMACPGDLEKNFLSALQTVDNYKIEKLRLFMFEGNSKRLVFRKID